MNIESMKQKIKDTGVGRGLYEWKQKKRMERRVRLCETNLEQAVSEIYNSMFDKPLDLKHPKTINEKMQYLKLNTYYDNPLVTKCADKYLVKEYLREIGMEEIVVPLYGVYDSPGEIEWDKLPEQFVVKCNHGCGYNMIVPDKTKLNIPEVKKTLCQWMGEEYWKFFAEPQYRFIEKKILIEKFLGDDIMTYKFYCFHGEPKVVYVSSEYDRYVDYFDMQWNRMDMYLSGHEHFPAEIKKPESLDRMRQLAQKLSAEFPFVCIDLYDIDGKIYLSEYTFIPTGGYMHLLPDKNELTWGEWLHI